MNFTRRSFLSAAAGAPLLAQQKGAAAGPKPNIVLVIAENLPSWALGCYGNQEIRTPQIDRIALSGARFVNNYVCTPQAAVSRATLFSGRTPVQHGVQGPDGSLAREVLLSDALAGGGYQCAYVGKWGTGGAAPGQGFAHVAADSLEAVTRGGGEFLDRQSKGKPFFLTLSYPGPGAPVEGVPAKYQELYKSVTFDSFGIQPVAENAKAGKEFLQNPVASLRRYAAAVTALDDQIPALQRKLLTKGLFEETILIFTSDSGALLGRHGYWADGLASDPVNMYDEAMQVPMIWQWAGRVPVQSARPELVSFYDFLPTVCDVTGVTAPAGKNLCGRSYLPLVLNKPLPKKEPWDDVVYGHFQDTEMVRDKYYKLVLRGKGEGPSELYDMRKDSRERNNRYSEPGFVTVRAELTKQLAAWRAKAV